MLKVDFLLGISPQLEAPWICGSRPHFSHFSITSIVEVATNKEVNLIIRKWNNEHNVTRRLLWKWNLTIAVQTLCLRACQYISQNVSSRAIFVSQLSNLFIIADEMTIKYYFIILCVLYMVIHGKYSNIYWYLICHEALTPYEKKIT